MHRAASRPSVCAVIPARGGSKGIPGKNLRRVGGLPLIAHTIRAARAAHMLDRVVVTTDCAEIAATAERFGAEIVHRPDHLATDTASSESALLHALDALEEQAKLPDLLCFLQCTSPLTAPEDIDGTIAAVLNQGADSGFAATRFFHFLWRETDDDFVGINHDKAIRQRRQDRLPEYLETGAVYVMKVRGFREAQHRFFGRTVFHEVPAHRVLDIDDMRELELAELLLRRSVARPLFPDPLDALVIDFDGVITDDRVVVDEQGVEAVICSRGDGLGISMLRQAGLPVLVLSKEQNAVVAARCRKLQVSCLQGIDDKLVALNAWLAERGLLLERVVYVGNDVNDVECLRSAGLGIAPLDAHPMAVAAASWTLSAPGGRGAVREVSDLILAADVMTVPRFSGHRT